MSKSLESYKWDKYNDIYTLYKAELNASEIIVTVGEYSLTVATQNDLEAYKQVLHRMEGLGSEIGTIKDRNGVYADLTLTELKYVIAKMIEYGESLWSKKESLIGVNNTGSELALADTIEKVEAIVW